ncbi:MAG: hypothetical protein Kow0063_40210 [Anaerolineae bacterium]
MGHWLVDTAGIGSLIVMGVGFSVLMAYITMLRWIQAAPRDPAPLEIDGHQEGQNNLATETEGKEA